MKPADLRTLLESVASNQLSIEAAIERLKSLPYEDLGFARLDHHRELRTGVPEIVLGSHKPPEMIARIVTSILQRGQLALVTRVDADKAAAVATHLPESVRASTRYEPTPELLVAGEALPIGGRGTIAVVTAGTSDLRAGEEAARTAELLGNRVERITDVGVAGLQRVLGVRDQLEAAEVVIVVAGMEGALPSVLKGLISRPVIAVPTSVGFGTGASGLAALLGMLNSCTPGITVVNIDNGFGAGYAASLMNRSSRVAS